MLVSAAVRDITERKRAEQTLRQSEAYLAEAQRLARPAVGHGTLRQVTSGTGPRNATACWVSILMDHFRDSRHFCSDFIRTTRSLQGNGSRKPSAKGRTLKWTTASFILAQGSGTSTPWATRLSAGPATSLNSWVR